MSLGVTVGMSDTVPRGNVGDRGVEMSGNELASERRGSADAEADGSAPPPLVEFVDIRKAFASVVAVDGVSFDIPCGQIVGLVGANGAGKSTLMNILAGVITPDGGQILLHGREVHLRNPRTALHAGIAFVPQELNLVPDMSVAENLLLGQFPSRAGVVRGGSLRERARELMVRVSLEKMDPNRPAGALSPVEQRLLTIARALAHDPQLLILDEPSATLPADTVEHLFPVLTALANSGHSLVYISHRLQEIKRLSDRVVAMRDGRVTGRVERDAVTIEGMVELVGGQPGRRGTSTLSSRRKGKVAVAARDLHGSRIRGVSFEVYPGEIVGLTGLQGSGRSELLRMIAGVQHYAHGSLDVLGGGPCRSPREAARRGVAYITEGRGPMLLRGMSVTENATVAALHSFSGRGFTSGRKERSAVGRLAQQLSIKGDPNQPIQTLSGGNQQKVLIGRWMLTGASLWILDEPTAGIDVHAREEIHRLIRDFADRGLAVIMASAEPEEIVSVCTHAFVIVEGAISAECTAPLAVEPLVAACYVGHDLGGQVDADRSLRDGMAP